MATDIKVPKFSNLSLDTVWLSEVLCSSSEKDGRVKEGKKTQDVINRIVLCFANALKFYESISGRP